MNCINVKDFGALGNGVADDTAAIQAALDAARQGSAVYIPAGRYRVRPLRIPSHITVMGNASWGYSAWGYGNNRIETGEPVDLDYNGNTVLVPMPTRAPAMVDMTGCCGTKLVGLTFDGLMWGQDFHCVVAPSAGGPQNIAFEDVRISHFTGCGLNLRGTQGFSIRRSLIIKNVNHAVDASGARNGSVMDNQLAYGDGAGFYGAGPGTGSFTIVANRIEGGNPGGVYLEDADTVSVAGNSFDFNAGPGVTLLGCTACTVTGNMTRGAGHDHDDDCNAHLRLENCRGVACMGNTSWSWPSHMGIQRLTWYGIVLRGLTDCVVSGNSLFDCASKEIVRDHGGHTNTLIGDNQGKVCQ